MSIVVIFTFFYVDLSCVCLKIEYCVCLQTCDHVSNVTLICWTPTLGSRRVQRRTVNEVTTAPSQPQQQQVAFGFVMDDVMGVRQMSGQMLTVFPDPQFDPFPETNRVKVYLSLNEYLTINVCTVLC
jgi:hypothetical protein